MRLDERCRSAQLLLVEDNRGDALLAKRAFRESQLPTDVTVAATAEEGLRMLRGEDSHAGMPRPDIILLDLNLPSMNGHEFLSIVKSDAELRGIPVIILSSSSADADVSRSYNRLANGYIVKPVAPAVYADVVNKIGLYWFSFMQMPPDHDPGQLN